LYDPKTNSFLNNILDQLDLDLSDKDLLRFITRLSGNFEVIHNHFLGIYGEKSSNQKHIKNLVEELVKAFQAREKDLRQWDLKRESDRGWLLSEQLVGSMFYLDRYSGNLKGFLTKIPYLKELGFNVIHLMPLLKSPKINNDGGYAVSDYRKVDERYGSMSEIKSIAKKLRENDMHLILDIVVNHTSNEHIWAKKAAKGEKKYQEFYYTYEDRQIPDSFESTLPEIFPTTEPGNFTYHPGMKKWIMTVFHDYQWDLNYTNPLVLIEMVKVLLYLANQGVDIFRLDAVPFLWKRMGTASQNEPEAHTILQLIKACIEVVSPGLPFIAEAIVAPPEIVKYFGDGDFAGKECDIAYNATLMTLLWDAVATKNSKLLVTGLRHQPAKPLGTTWLSYIRSHDDIGLGYEDAYAREVGYTPHLHRQYLVNFFTGKYDDSFAMGLPFMFNPKTGDARISGTTASLAGLEKALGQGKKAELDKAIDRIILLHAIIISFGGIPLIYYGDELGTTNHYSYVKESGKSEDNRWVHRPIFNWKKAEKRNQKGTVEYRIFQALKKLIAIRKESPEFADLNNRELLTTDNEHIFAYLRIRDNLKTLCLYNLHDEPQKIGSYVLHQVNFDLKKGIIDKYRGKPAPYNEYYIELPPYQFFWITQKV